MKRAANGGTKEGRGVLTDRNMQKCIGLFEAAAKDKSKYGQILVPLTRTRCRKGFGTGIEVILPRHRVRSFRSVFTSTLLSDSYMIKKRPGSEFSKSLAETSSLVWLT